jgi:hypothetical protein
VKQQKQTPDYTVAHRLAARLFDSAFAACEHVPEVDRQLLLKEIGNRIIAMLHPNQPVKPIRVLGIEIKQEEVRDSTQSVR